MKTKIISTLILLIATSVSANYGQEITLTTTTGNTSASKSTIEFPALNGNPNAIIVATQIGTLNPHPIGAWYYNGKWNIFNINHSNMAIGAQFKVQVFLQPDANHYVHVVVTANNQTVSRTALNHPELDFHPEAQVKIFQNHGTYTRNPSEAKVYYDNAKWFIENVNGTPLYPNTAYNVVVGPPPGGIPPGGIPIGIPPANLATPTSTSTTGNAGGDLSGTYPNPNVIGLQGNPISNKTPAVGDTLRWNGTAWEPYTPPVSPFVNANQLHGRDIVTTEPTAGQVLKFGGGSWYPADDNVSTSTAIKPSVLSFNQNVGNIGMVDVNVNTISIPGLDNQSFTLAQSSRVVFHTVIEAKIWGGNLQANATHIRLTVEILNASNLMVARSTSNGWLTFDTLQSLNSSGIGVLPAGTYHTKVSITRQAGGAKLFIYGVDSLNNQGGQGGQMIIQIFPN